MNDQYAIWALICFGVAIALFFVEVFVPSGGIIGFFAAAALVGGVVMLFKINTTLGLIGATVSLAAVPFLFAFAIKLWPETPMARWLTLKSPPPIQTESGTIAHDTSLLNATGKAVTDLRPIGACVINGKRIECLATTGMIHSGQKVRVVSVDGLEVKVKAEA